MAKGSPENGALNVGILVDEFHTFFQTAQATLTTTQECIGDRRVGGLGDLFLNFCKNGAKQLDNGNDQ
jgi:hypothetical protein